MAAILCRSIGDLCNSVCLCVAWPCRYCGDACSSCCRAVTQVVASPFSPYLITTLALNVPPLAFGFQSLVLMGQSNKRCPGDIWLWVNSSVCFIHILAAFYIANRIQQEQRHEEDTLAKLHPAIVGGNNGIDTEMGGSSKQTNYQAVHDVSKNASKGSWLGLGYSGFYARQQQSHGLFHNSYDDGHANSFKRLKQVLCYDVGVAIYILVVIFWFIWQSAGISEIVTHFGNDNGGEYCYTVEKWVAVSITCGFVYASIVCVAFSCSFLCLRR